MSFEKYIRFERELENFEAVPVRGVTPQIIFATSPSSQKTCRENAKSHTGFIPA